MIGSDNEIANLDGIVDILRERGVDAVRITDIADVPAPSAAMIAISPSLVADRRLLTILRGWADTRLIPVRVAPIVDTRQVPPFLADLNWILWDSTDVGARNASLLNALQFDLGRYRNTEGLEAQAAAWVAADRDPDYLVSDRKAIAQAASDNAAGEPSAQLVEYIAASARATRREWWKRNGRWAFRAVALIGVIAIALTGWRAVQNLRSANTLAGTLLNVDDNPDRADLQALKLGGLIDQQAANGRAVPDTAQGALLQAMSHPWDLGVLGYTKTAAINAFILGNDPTVAISADGEGTLAEWSLDTGAMTSRRQISQSPLYLADATPNGRFAATFAADNTIGVTELSSGTTITASSSKPAGLQISQSGNTVAIYDDSGSITVLTRSANANGLAPRKVGTYEEVFDIQGGAGEAIWAVVKDNDDLLVVNATSNAVVHRSALSGGADVRDAAISPSGELLALVGDDGQLWTAPVGGSFAPTGLPASRTVKSLAIDDRGRVLISSPAAGPQVTDLTAGTTARICAAVSVVEVFSVSSDGTRVACLSRGVGIISDLTEVTTTPKPTNLQVTTSRSAALGSSSIRLGDDGMIHLVHKSITAAMNPTSTSVGAPWGASLPWIPGTIFGEGTPTVVAINADGSTVAVGTSAGVVTEIDLYPEGLIAIAGRWRPANRAVTAIGWHGDNELWMETGTDVWWRAPSCAGCGVSTQRLFQRIRDRQWMCYPADTRDIFTDRTRSTFDLHPCADPIEATS
ncbi:hypothetical protein GIY30_02375 [Gordonia sp. HNM0687]|uniref:Uncharacterized protein n=1 Tax=Gordonia mangrovi TaxID=2665643 RepID=A0A6L7GLC4_9ACTN|nr:WD40 repeat domain-containing protein [Gordonia mangrovi]MXP20217.1 hypothetical protein [Gordonia mangrovi]UVF79174.1 WD40 repeat domain-containing protein [Gordonia mangrovi]